MNRSIIYIAATTAVAVIPSRALAPIGGVEIAL